LVKNTSGAHIKLQSEVWNLVVHAVWYGHFGAVSSKDIKIFISLAKGYLLRGNTMGGYLSGGCMASQVYSQELKDMQVLHK